MSKLKACVSAVIAVIALATATGGASVDFNRNVRLLSAGHLSFDRNIENLATRRVQPAYPPMAQKYRIEGTVTVQVSVGTDGKVAKAEFVRGHNIFRSVSLDAAKRWEFKPPSETSLEGEVQFVFKLAIHEPAAHHRR